MRLASCVAGRGTGSMGGAAGSAGDLLLLVHVRQVRMEGGRQDGRRERRIVKRHILPIMDSYVATLAVADGDRGGYYIPLKPTGTAPSGGGCPLADRRYRC